MARNKVDQNMGMEEAATFVMRFIANTSFVSLFVTRKTFISFEGNGEASESTVFMPSFRREINCACKPCRMLLLQESHQWRTYEDKLYG
jgi:hypothetical protein